MTDLITLIACCLALFYYWEWQHTRDDLDALHDAVCRVGRGEAEVVQIDSHTFRIEDNK